MELFSWWRCRYCSGHHEDHGVMHSLVIGSDDYDGTLIDDAKRTALKGSKL